MVDQQIMAVIPARGGSKRIPKKNIIDFFGKPLIAWTIEAAKETRLFKRIIVSTDDEEIASISRAYGAEVPFLRDKFADDHSPVSLATIHAVKQACDYYHEDYDLVVQLMPNCPLRRSHHIVESVQYFMSHRYPFQISCFKFGWMNPWWAFKLDENGRPHFFFTDTLKKRSQDMDSLYCPTGAVWVADKSQLFMQNTFYGEPYVFYPISWTAAVDIDDTEDLKMAKAVYLMENYKDI